MQRDTIISEATELLREVFETYQPQVRAIYLWGSATCEDFDPARSDIDSIAIVSDDFPVDMEETIRAKLGKDKSFPNPFGFRLLYISELNTGVQKSPLVGFIEVPLLLADMKYWIPVIGSVARSDFSLPDATIDELIAIRVKRNAVSHWEDVSAITPADFPYFLKNMARTLDLIARKNGFDGPFSYGALVANTPEEYKECARALIECRSAKYSETTRAKYTNIFQKFIDDLRM